MAKSKGYTKLKNDVFDSALSADLTLAEFKIVMFLIRYSIGFNRNTARMSQGYIANGTGINKKTVARCMKSLKQKGIIEVEYAHRGSLAQVYKFYPEKMSISYGNKCPYEVDKNYPINGGKNVPQDITEDITDIDIKEKKENSSQNHPKNEPDFDAMSEEEYWEYVLGE